MSCQPPQWARRNASPKQQLRPVRATLPVSLMRQQSQGSPTKNNPTRNDSPSNTAFDLDKPKASDERKPTLFLGPRGEKSKTLNLRTQPPQHHIRRTASLDALLLTTSWQPETVFLGHFMVDKATQTPDEWTEAEWRKDQWKSMVTVGEHLEVKYIRQKLQRTNQNSRASNLLLCSQRQSPIQGDHFAVSNLESGCIGVCYSGAFGMVHKVTHATSAFQAANLSRPIPIAQGPKSNTPRLQSSLESLNQEIEKLVLKDTAGTETDGSTNRVFEPAPDGHRAPIAELFHSISSPGHESHTSSETASRSHSTSPVIPIIPGNTDYSISPSTENDSECIYKFSSSPHINQFLTREPPDGCEKVKIDEESRRQPVQDLPPGGCLLKPQVTNVLLPSQSSAFCPLYKELDVPGQLCDPCNVLPPLPSTSKCHK